MVQLKRLVQDSLYGKKWSHEKNIDKDSRNLWPDTEFVPKQQLHGSKNAMYIEEHLMNGMNKRPKVYAWSLDNDLLFLLFEKYVTKATATPVNFYSHWQLDILPGHPKSCSAIEVEGCCTCS